MELSRFPRPIQLSPGIGCPPAIPNDAFASPMPAQSVVSLTIVIWLYLKSTSLTSEGVMTRFQLTARLRKGAVVRLPRSSGSAVCRSSTRTSRDREAAEDLVLVRRIPVHATIALVGADGGESFANEVTDDAAGHSAVRNGKQRGIAENASGDRADPTDGNLIACERHPRQRIFEGAGQNRQVALAPARRRH